MTTTTVKKLSLPHLWEWPTILSLDAPLIAVLWQALFARALKIDLAGHHYFLLALAVWLLYVADRWVDGLKLSVSTAQSSRHRFYVLRRWPLLYLWLAVLLLSLVFVLFTLDGSEIISGSLLLAAVLVYFAGVHLAEPVFRRIPKELFISLLFGAGVTLFIVPLKTAAVLLPLLLFVVLCFLNCSFIALWEEQIDRQQGQHSLLQDYPGVANWLPWLALGLAVLALLLVIFLPPSPLLLAVAASSSLLYLLQQTSARFSSAALRVLADVSLLTPILPLVLGLLPG